MKHFFAHCAYDRRKLLDKAAFLDFVAEVVRRSDTAPGFKVIPRRWVVESSIGWLTPLPPTCPRLRTAPRRI
ncbi:Transposase, is4 family [Pararhodospirillum photometricum DSM 122]|uniref:Transposase, is4 family n=1 Tax=Pararhodospirillum photometricum DSM 122 TaxID=1150469 RepID=H6SLZ8_PARPM|nr:Transposase, is4 family [Pararhodospirillum photometricum DSM 122]